MACVLGGKGINSIPALEEVRWEVEKCGPLIPIIHSLRELSFVPLGFGLGP